MVVLELIFYLEPPDTLEISWQSLEYNGNVNISCFGLSDGSINTVDISGGIPGFEYSWTRDSDGWTSSDLQPDSLLPDIYHLEVKDTNECIAGFSDTLFEPIAPLLIGDDSIKLPSCANVSDGFIRLEPITGGTPDYKYLWHPSGDTTRDADSIVSGTWTLRVEDTNQCFDTATYFVDQPDPVEGQIILDTLYNNQMISCYGANNAILTVVDSGGIPPFKYQWFFGSDSLSTNSIIYNRPPGYHRVEVTDKNDCAIFAEIIVTQPDSLHLGTLVDQVECNGDASGKIETVMAGGTSPYLYEWSNGESKSIISDLPAGEYFVYVLDANACDHTKYFEIQELPPLLLNPDYK